MRRTVQIQLTALAMFASTQFSFAEGPLNARHDKPSGSKDESVAMLNGKVDMLDESSTKEDSNKEISKPILNSLSASQASFIKMPGSWTKKVHTFAILANETGWIDTFNGCRIQTPAFSDGMVFVGGEGDRTVTPFFALNARTGETIWHFDGCSESASAAVVDHGFCVFNELSCRTFVLNAKTGQVLWKKWLTDYVDAQPAVYGNSVFLTYHPTFRSYSYLERRSLETGNLLWQVQFPGKPISAAVIEKDKVYVSSSNGTVECCDAGTGKLIWNQPMEASSAPLPINGKVIVSQDPVRTRKRSSFGYDGHRPAIAANAVVKIVGNSIEADDVKSGREIWKTDLDVAICKKGLFGPAVGKQDVYLTTGSGYIIELDAKSGKERQCYFTKQSFDSQPCLAQGNLYAGTADGRLVCFPMGNDADGWNCWGGNPQHKI